MKFWKNIFPLMRCPGCRRWLHIRGKSRYTMRFATKKEIAEVKGDDSPTPPVKTITRTRAGGGD